MDAAITSRQITGATNVPHDKVVETIESLIGTPKLDQCEYKLQATARGKEYWLDNDASINVANALSDDFDTQVEYVKSVLNWWVHVAHKA